MDEQANQVPQIDTTSCTGCGDCVIHCPASALQILADKAVLVHADLCTYCADCELICPTFAIEAPYLITRRSPK